MIRSLRPQTRYVIRKPRASGDDPNTDLNFLDCVTVNPARAGMIRNSLALNCSDRCKPRASGDDPLGVRNIKQHGQ